MAQAVEALPQDVSATKPRLVFFHSRSCGKCRRVEGFIAQVLQRRHNHGTFVLLPVDSAERPDLLERFNVGEVPSLVVVSLWSSPTAGYADGLRTHAAAATSKACSAPG